MSSAAGLPATVNHVEGEWTLAARCLCIVGHFVKSETKGKAWAS